jgi:hypothetical protein
MRPQAVRSSLCESRHFRIKTLFVTALLTSSIWWEMKPISLDILTTVCLLSIWASRWAFSKPNLGLILFVGLHVYFLQQKSSAGDRGKGRNSTV